MAHKEYGFQQVQKLIQEVASYGHPDQPPKLVGKGITTMLSPLPRAKRAKNPNRRENGGSSNDSAHAHSHGTENGDSALEEEESSGFSGNGNPPSNGTADGAERTDEGSDGNR